MANNRLPCPLEYEIQLTHVQVIDKGIYGLAKAENSLFSPNVNVAQDFTFSETDNGLHTMTDTFAFALKHVQNDDPHLANILERYHSDAIDSERMDENVSCLDLPNPFKVKSEGVDFGCGNWRRKKSLKEIKREPLRAK
ncbi:hypothetical protein RMATCC62417_11936 [Rhizopus microsporus]|nr:hypothetical protein RMATCC62417_11936 [Rhizopus microsporus]